MRSRRARTFYLQSGYATFESAESSIQFARTFHCTFKSLYDLNLTLFVLILTFCLVTSDCHRYSCRKQALKHTLINFTVLRTDLFSSFLYFEVFLSYVDPGRNLFNDSPLFIRQVLNQIIASRVIRITYMKVMHLQAKHEPPIPLKTIFCLSCRSAAFQYKLFRCTSMTKAACFNLKSYLIAIYYCIQC